MLAYDGTPEIKAEFEKLMAEYYPDKGLDADAAQKLQDQFMARLIRTGSTATWERAIGLTRSAKSNTSPASRGT